MANLEACLITYSYKHYYRSILNYMYFRINDKCDAEDLAQDVFVNLLEYKQMLRQETLKSFVFTIAHNILIDYLRKHVKRQGIISSYIYDTSSISTDQVEEQFVAKDILSLEYKKLKTFSKQCRTVYYLTRFEEMTIQEISEEMNLSKRTVESHLLKGRKIMRSYIRQCI